jgi:hypothetical protein
MIKNINLNKIVDRAEKIDTIYGNYLGRIRCSEVKLQMCLGLKTNISEVLLWTN